MRWCYKSIKALRIVCNGWSARQLLAYPAILCELAKAILILLPTSYNQTLPALHVNGLVSGLCLSLNWQEVPTFSGDAAWNQADRTSGMEAGLQPSLCCPPSLLVLWITCKTANGGSCLWGEEDVPIDRTRTLSKLLHINVVNGWLGSQNLVPILIYWNYICVSREVSSWRIYLKEI